MSMILSVVSAAAAGAVSLLASEVAQRLIAKLRGNKNKGLVVKFADGRIERLQVQAGAATDEIANYVKDYIVLENDVLRVLKEELQSSADIRVEMGRAVDFLVSSKKMTVAIEVKMNSKDVNQALVDNIFVSYPNIDRIYVLVGSEFEVLFPQKIREKIDSGKLVVRSCRDAAEVAADIKSFL